jgi:DNA-binding GntR family transcriptional regulator
MNQLPQYRRIYEHLRARILDNEYVAGDMLPSEFDLCKTFDVARLTVRKALEQLVTDGFISRQQGKGSIVKGSPKGVGILSLVSTTTALNSNYLRTHITYKQELREWDEAFNFAVEPAEKDAGCIYFERLRLLGDTPVFYDITMLPNLNIPRFVNIDMENRSLFDTLRTNHQIVVTGGVQQLFAIRADKRLQSYLDVKSGYPILQLNRKISTNRPGFHIYSQVFCSTHRYGIIGTF